VMAWRARCEGHVGVIVTGSGDAVREPRHQDTCARTPGPPDEGRPDYPDLPASPNLPRMPRQQRARAKREALLRAAATLFAERGYDATATPEIAAAAGVSVGTLYSYFLDKRQILLTLAAGTGEALRDLDLDNALAGPDPRRTLAQTLAKALPYDVDHYRLQRAWTLLENRDPELTAYAIQVQRWVYYHLLVAIRRAVAEGRTWPDLDVERTAWIVTDTLHHIWHRQFHPDEITEEEFGRQRDALADLLYHAIFRG
jgi:AcrR family transcriptional regulator